MRTIHDTMVLATVHQIDPVAREVQALVSGRLLEIHVPPDCPVILRGERVKLRLLQRGDRVRLSLDRQATSWVASRIEAVLSGVSASECSTLTTGSDVQFSTPKS